MRIAVIGAGIVGVTTAFELTQDGHAVTVFERRGSVAEETSFANAGVVAPGYVTPWAAPGMPAKVFKQLWGRHAAVRLSRPFSPGLVPWLWRWWRACKPQAYAAHRASLHRLASYSRERLLHLMAQQRIEFEHSRGYLVLLRSPTELTQARSGLKLMAELGADFKLVDAARARQIEPGLSPDTALHAAVHLPQDAVGNCRQFAHLLKQQAQQGGAQFQFLRHVTALRPAGSGNGIEVSHALAASSPDEAAPARTSNAKSEDSSANSQTFDAVVVCAALGALDLLRPLGLRPALLPVYGYSITLPLRQSAAHSDIGPRSGVMDERYKVAISRLGQRVRVAGGAQLGGLADQHHAQALATLYKVLDDWFPGCAAGAAAQVWKGARPMLPDGPPLLGASGIPGLWLNLGHGSSGWALSCGSARIVADLMSGRTPPIRLDGFAATPAHRAAAAA